MTNPAPFTEIWRGPLIESRHFGHAVICDARGDIVEAWGNPEETVLPRSSAKMIQALPLLESGAFLEAFVCKGRMTELMKKIPVYVILHPDAALLGAARQAMTTGEIK